MSKLEEKKAKLIAEINALIDWEILEIEKVDEHLKKSKKFKQGLDANSESYLSIREERNKRLHDILNQYNLPKGTVLELN